MSIWSEILMLEIINQMSSISFGLMSSLTYARTEFLSVNRQTSQFRHPLFIDNQKPKSKKGIGHFSFCSQHMILQNLRHGQEKAHTPKIAVFLHKGTYPPLTVTIFSLTGPFRDCFHVRQAGHTTSGMYLLKTDGSDRLIQAWCEHGLDNGGWTVLQRRRDGSVNFFRNWENYKVS